MTMTGVFTCFFPVRIMFLGPEQRLQAVSEGPIEIVLFIIIYYS